jgi:hypothetical protein
LLQNNTAKYRINSKQQQQQQQENNNTEHRTRNKEHGTRNNNNTDHGTPTTTTTRNTTNNNTEHGTTTPQLQWLSSKRVVAFDRSRRPPGGDNGDRLSSPVALSVGADVIQCKYTFNINNDDYDFDQDDEILTSVGGSVRPKSALLPSSTYDEPLYGLEALPQQVSAESDVVPVAAVGRWNKRDRSNEKLDGYNFANEDFDKKPGDFDHMVVVMAWYPKRDRYNPDHYTPK